VGSRGGAGQSVTDGDAPRRLGTPVFRRGRRLPRPATRDGSEGGEYWCVGVGREEIVTQGGGGGGRARPATTGSRFKGGSVDRDRRVEEAGESKGAAQRCRVGR
jgi:hypothetical protein